MAEESASSSVPEGSPAAPPAAAESELRQRTGTGVKRLFEKDQRFARLFHAASLHTPESVARFFRVAEPAVAMATKVWDLVFPVLVVCCTKAQAVYAQLPPHVVPMVYGIFMLLFGGHYAATICVIEAFRQSGAWEKIGACLLELVGAYQRLSKASEDDDEADDDHDGVADVDQITPAQLFVRKVALAMRTVDPQKVNAALAGLYTGFLSAVVVVQFRFAKTIALGASIGDFLVRSVSIVLVPVLARLVPEAYAAWVLLLVGYICKAIGISVAWTFQFFQSMLQSAVNGALTFARALINFLHDRKMIDISPDDTYIDEIVGWILAALGLWVQYQLGFAIPFPLNIPLLPLSISEWTLRWYASSGNNFAARAAAVGA